MGVSPPLIQSTQEPGAHWEGQVWPDSRKGVPCGMVHTLTWGVGGTGLVLELTPLTGRSDIGEGSPPGPNHPGKSRGLVLPQQGLRTGTNRGGVRTTDIWLGGYAPLTLPTFTPKSSLSSPASSVHRQSLSNSINLTGQQPQPQALPMRESRRLVRRSSRPDARKRREARSRRPDPRREEGER